MLVITSMLILNPALVVVIPKEERGYVEAISPTIDIRYVISGLLLHSVHSCRIHSAKISTTGRRRGVDGGRTPSILDYNYPEYRRQQLLIAESTGTSSTGNNNTASTGSNFCRVFLDSEVNTRILLAYSLNKFFNVVELIDRMYNIKEKGWLRQMEKI